MFYLRPKLWMSILYLNYLPVAFFEVTNLMIISFELAIWKHLMSHVVRMFSSCITEQSYSYQEMQDTCFHLFNRALS